ncbi:hypothetical protein C3747_84g15 [Trypanosoma cruzi]|uniref:Tetratricopeptide repeat n=2 Tax=Trypanosoma cruzi TaxID=5693 RepID=Q4DI61_TRYCC|nr:hypothetical protein, conserved [Trypanosoma cruzi]EAN92201.1 hypothetical protein, conserved [Trypanosoma cruzi]PWV08894.1 hypothetical protein C3747_84g15 [Trypanosoma cruzi]RNC60078.1 hypothetical protein TcCL_ESM02294 [Trypanosoma cruzi]|eukprot:XP_814052.1 hypothetical protein [Trypanosoma cruzi strain CL Brener]
MEKENRKGKTQDVAPPPEFRVDGSVADDSSRRDASVSQGASEEQQAQPSDGELLHEVLAMNTLAMQRCNTEALEYATTILSDAYMKLHNHVSSGDERLMDTLRSTTLNNLGVVECHRGQHRQALSHFEAARQLEEKWGSASPSVALNTCAAYNALGMYDKATAAAIETIDMLRTLTIQEEKGKTSTPPVAEGGSYSLQGTGIEVAKSENKALWGAAWHNLAVAQINTAKLTKHPTEHCNAAVLFQNAMRATQELLGNDHPMTKSVTETYRAVRDVLRSYGVYKQHHTMLTVPPRPVDPRDEEDDMERYLQQCVGKSRRRAKDKFHRDLTITFCGEATNGVKLTERLDPTPYPGAVDVTFRDKSRKKMPRVLRGMTLSGTLLRAGQLYGNPHPLLYSLPPNYDPMDPSNPNDGCNLGSNPYVGMTSNSRAPAPWKESPSKQRKKNTTARSALSTQFHSDLNFQRIPPSLAHQQSTNNYHEILSVQQQPPSSYNPTQEAYRPMPSSSKSKPDVYNPTQEAYRSMPSSSKSKPDSYNQTPSSQNPTQEAYRPMPSSSKSKPDVYNPTQEAYRSMPSSSKSKPDVYNPTQEAYRPMPSSSKSKPDVYNPTQEAYRSMPSSSKPRPDSYNQAPAAYTPTPNIQQQSPSTHQQAPSSSQPKSAGGGSGKKARRSTPGRITPPSKARPESRELARGQQASPKLPPLGKAPARNGPASGSSVRARDDGNSLNAQIHGAYKLGTPTADPTYEQVKYILLAEPQENQRQQRGGVGKYLVDDPTGQISLLGDAERHKAGSGCFSEADGNKNHPLFDAMWVAAQRPMDASETRAVGRPSYYVSSVLDISKDSVRMPEEALQMMLSSISSSEDETAPMPVPSIM